MWQLIRKKAKSFGVVLGTIVAIICTHHFVISRPEPDLAPAPAAVSMPVPLAVQIDDVISATKPDLSPAIESLSASGEFQRAKSVLLDRALVAVEDADQSALAFHLGELGELALLEGDLGMADVYLSEALELYDELGDELQVAGIHVQYGRLHLYARQRARRASDSYDQLLISRWKISEGRFREAEDQLKDIVATSLSLDRFGAAASAYETLYKGYSREFDTLQAHSAGIEAIKLHAASGNTHHANRLLEQLKSDGLSGPDADEVGRQLNAHYREYEASVKAIGAAQDYGQLYNQLLSRGDALQAWRFRQQAEESIANVSRRARYRRQPDVLVELYRSNFSMDRAVSALQKASAVYSRHGLQEGVNRSQQLQGQIY